MNDEITPRETAIEFPCDFPIKVIGDYRDDFMAEVLRACQQHVPSLSQDAIKQRPSKNNAYVALTVTVPVTSQSELDAIYMSINQLSGLKMVL